jgi:hypothetical protein
MSVRKHLFLWAVLLLILGGGIAILCAINREEDAAGIVLVVFASVGAVLITIGFFVGGRPKLPSDAAARKLLEDAEKSAREIVQRASEEASRMLGDAADKAMSLASLDSGKCKQCGNPRTGKFCPKCGHAAA